MQKVLHPAQEETPKTESRLTKPLSLVYFIHHNKQNVIWHINNARGMHCENVIGPVSIALPAYLFRDMSRGRRRHQTELVEGVEAKSVNVAFFRQHHCVVFSCRHLGAVVGHETLHHPGNLWRGARRRRLKSTIKSYSQLQANGGKNFFNVSVVKQKEQLDT